MCKKPSANARGVDLNPGLGRSLREGNGNPLQYSCLGNPTDRGPVGYSPRGCKRVGRDLGTKQQQHSTVYIPHLLYP